MTTTVVVGPAADAGTPAVAHALRGAGVPCAAVTSFTDVRWELGLDDRGRATGTLALADGTPVVGAVVRGVPQVDDEFCAAEQAAAWWAALAALPGPVVGRPTWHGTVPTVDRLRLDGVPVWAGRWALRAPVAAGGRGHDGGWVRPGADGSPGSWERRAVAGDDVVDVTPCDPAATARLVVAGDAVLVATPDAVVPVAAAVRAAVLDALGGAVPVLCGLVADVRDPGRPALLDVGPAPAHLLDDPAVTAGLVAALTPGPVPHPARPRGDAAPLTTTGRAVP